MRFRRCYNARPLVPSPRCVDIATATQLPNLADVQTKNVRARRLVVLTIVVFGKLAKIRMSIVLPKACKLLGLREA